MQHFSGNTILIHRIKFLPEDRSLPIEMERSQFPVRPSFSVTSNKSQGRDKYHSFKFYIINLKKNFFRTKFGHSGGEPRTRVFFAWVRINWKYLSTGLEMIASILQTSFIISCSQLYVALSRVRSPQNLKLFQPQESKSGKTVCVIKIGFYSIHSWLFWFHM